MPRKKTKAKAKAKIKPVAKPPVRATLVAPVAPTNPVIKVQ